MSGGDEDAGKDTDRLVSKHDMIVQPMNTANKTGNFAEAGPLNRWLRIEDRCVTPPQEDGKPKSLAK